ncbi:MOSC domain-containing protein [Methylomonas paludis]|uniref:MOSC domain-containing protein n=1 Tax=Methylomonas paludis TaxID=1173101 RepID=A0A975MPM4_9GAMM|nr:MOSC N-terminal beta barrel domain-containing protein [Methylomonas paludis]QWF71474.1 MOSC domain-containing protein [Methylomonas paludis]
MPILSQIHVYPVKSLAGFQVDAWPVDKTGLRYDRKWMLVDAEGQFLSQRRLPRMALISTRISAGQLILSANGAVDFSLALDEDRNAPALPVQIWKDNCLAHTISGAADQWLSRVLDYPCRLVYLPEHSIRPVDPNYALSSDETAFSDGFPFLLVSENSLHSLSAAVGQDLEMIRFRPNLVVAECEAYAEDSWRRISINGINFRLPKPCSRCQVPTIDPYTGQTGKEPLTTLARLRQWQHKVYFGQNVLHDGLGELVVGQAVLITETGAKQPPLNIF